MRRLFFFGAMCLIFLPNSSVEAGTLVLSDTDTRYQIGPIAEVLRDSRRTLTIADVTSGPHALDFHADGRPRPYFGFTRDAFWFRFTLRNNSGIREWYLDTTREWVEEVDLFSQGADGSWQMEKVGTEIPYAARRVANERPVFLVDVPPGQERAYYLRMRTSGSMALKGELSAPLVFHRGDDLKRLTDGGYYAILLVMSVYNFFVFLPTRDRSYAWLSLLMLSLCSIEALAHGHLYHLLNRPLNQQPLAFAVVLGGLSFTFLTRTFLRTKRFTPRLDKIILVANVPLLATGVLAVWSDYSVPAAFVTVLTPLFLILVASAWRWWQGFTPAAYFTLAAASYIVLSQPVIFQLFGILPPNVLTEFGTHIGAVSMACLYSFGLADHIRRLHLGAEKFVPKAILRQLGRESVAEAQLGDATDAVMTVLFSDIRSFTSIAENMSPKENFEFVNAILARLVPPITRAGGIIDKYIGDSIMAIFPGSADDALRASRDMLQALETFNRDQVGRFPTISIGIGLHRGNVRLGTVGDAQRMSATVISDTVNIASRLENLSKDYGTPIILSEAVVSALSPALREGCESIGDTRVKGKEEHIAIFRLRESSEATGASGS